MEFHPATRMGYVLLADGSHLASVGDGIRDGGSDETIAANARLMSVAPELLEYCKMLLEDCKAMAEDHSVGGDWDWSLTERNLCEVIGKAEGEIHSEE